MRPSGNNEYVHFKLHEDWSIIVLEETVIINCIELGDSMIILRYSALQRHVNNLFTTVMRSNDDDGGVQFGGVPMIAHAPYRRHHFRRTTACGYIIFISISTNIYKSMLPRSFLATCTTVNGQFSLGGPGSRPHQNF